jgi:uncharacterized protein YbaR (Trm112 family)
VAFHRRIDEPEPSNRPAGSYEVRRARSSRLATGTLACPLCDAPLAVVGWLSPSDGLACPYCRHTGATREFLSLAEPTRPTRVSVRVVHRRR